MDKIRTNKDKSPILSMDFKPARGHTKIHLYGIDYVTIHISNEYQKLETSPKNLKFWNYTQKSSNYFMVYADLL